MEEIQRIKKTSDASEEMVVDTLQPVVNVCFQTKDALLRWISLHSLPVINCTAQVSKKSKKLDIIVAVAEKFLGLKNFTSKDLQVVLAPEDPPSQVPLEPV